MKKISAIIIEDEEPGRLLIQKYLEDQPDIDVIAVCENGFEGVRTINETEPDLVFLDIQMPKINGFEMLEILDNRPEIIFTTAFNEYAIKAFELNAIDYLLKPFSKERFLDSLNKARGRIGSGAGKPAPTIISRMPPEPLTRVVVRDRGNIHVFGSKSIVFIEAMDDYVMIHTVDKKLMKQQTMKYYEDHLDPSVFVRVHRSYIVNVQYIDKLEPFEKDRYIIVFKHSSTRIKVSRTGYQKLREVLKF